MLVILPCLIHAICTCPECKSNPNPSLARTTWINDNSDTDEYKIEFLSQTWLMISSKAAFGESKPVYIYTFDGDIIAIDLNQMKPGHAWLVRWILKENHLIGIHDNTTYTKQ